MSINVLPGGEARALLECLWTGSRKAGVNVGGCSGVEGSLASMLLLPVLKLICCLGVTGCSKSHCPQWLFQETLICHLGILGSPLADPSPRSKWYPSLSAATGCPENLPPLLAPCYRNWGLWSLPCCCLLCPISGSVSSCPAYRFLRRQVRWSGTPIFWRISHSLLWSTQSKTIVVNETKVKNHAITYLSG